MLVDEIIGVGEQRALFRIEAVGNFPCVNCGDLLFGHAEPAATLAMLGVDELATRQPSSSGLPKFAQLGIESTLGTAIETKALHRMIEDVGRKRKDGPPVTGCTRRCAWFVDRVTVAKEEVVER